MKLAARIFMSIYLTFLIASVASAAQPADQSYYAKVNIWYENPGKILSTNYHRGAIISFGSKIKIISQSKDKISFTCDDQPGVDFVLVNVPRHSLVTTDVLFKQYFTQTDPKGKDAEYSKFSAKEKENIENGTLAEGMSKEAVAASYGYPPKHKTPALTLNLWTYWDARYVKKLVTFKNNIVVKLEEVKEDFEGHPSWHIYVP